MPSTVRTAILERNGIDRVALIALLLLIGTSIFSTALVQLATGCLTALWIATIVKQGSVGFRRTMLDWPFLAFIVGRVFSVAFSTYPEISLPSLHIEILFYAVFFVFTNTIRVDRDKEIISLVKLLLLTASTAAVLGILQYSSGLVLRAQSLTSGPYTLGLCLVTSLPFVLWLEQDNMFFKHSHSRYFIIIIMALAVILTFDRLHWIVMAGVFILGALVTKDRLP